MEKLSGKTASPKMPIGDMGFTAHFTDIEINVGGLWREAKI